MSTEGRIESNDERFSANRDTSMRLKDIKQRGLSLIWKKRLVFEY